MPNPNTDPLYDNSYLPDRDVATLGEVTPPDVIPPVTLPVFITASELSTHIYEGVVNAISDSDASLMVTAIAGAIREASGYMSRYDLVSIFNQTGTNRDPLLMQYIKEIAVWNFIVIANPNIDYEVRQNRYKFAVRWLEKVQDGRFVPIGWPIVTQTYLSTLWHVKSRPKRGNNY